MEDATDLERQELDPLDVLRRCAGNVIARIPAPIALCDQRMRLVGVSDAWLSTLGLDGKNLIGTSLYDACPWLPQAHREAHRKSLSEGMESSKEYCAPSPEGGVTRQRWVMSPFFSNEGVVGGLVLLCEDITERKEIEQRLEVSELRLRHGIEAAGIGLFEKDHVTGETYFSPTILDFLKTNPLPREFEDWLAFVDPSEREKFIAARASSLDPKGGGIFAVDFHPVVEGERKTFELQGKVLFEGEGEDKRAKQTIGVVFDRTDQARLTDALAHAQRLETVGRMAGMIAHDFNNLLTVILSNLELATRTNPDDIARDHIERAIEATKLGASFGHRLLALAASRERRPMAFSLDEHLVETWSVIERVLGESVHTQLIPGASGGIVFMDQSELDGALLNLVVNSREAMGRSGEISITTGITHLKREDVAAQETVQPGEFVWMTVADTGKGMAPEVVDQAIEPFFTTKSSDHGTGLGLTSVAVTLARSQGFMKIDSEADRGTKVTLFLPRVAAAARRPGSPSAASMTLGDGELILVVEDDPLVRETVLDRLEALGYAVLEAGDVTQALSIIEQGEPVDMVFSDVVLPGERSGYDLACQLHLSHPEIPVLLTSGHTSRHLVRRSDQDPEIELLQKPYSIAALAASVARALKAARSRA
ncbi:ATP-binding protein [Thioclava atlantica]|uniref:histidine kinase n=1 Tax=Thioclava atlantica TaxID=1317124 RepID=A0A085TT48_9RHOB|nr:ATP-binding protein [Thioclava atlantica]KFE33895.1 PAS/PAC sensor hybrid histidine kinase [Thioclava atlantica]